MYIKILRTDGEELGGMLSEADSITYDVIEVETQEDYDELVGDLWTFNDPFDFDGDRGTFIRVYLHEFQNGEVILKDTVIVKEGVTLFIMNENGMTIDKVILE